MLRRLHSRLLLRGLAMLRLALRLTLLRLPLLDLLLRLALLRLVALRCTGRWGSGGTPCQGGLPLQCPASGPASVALSSPLVQNKLRRLNSRFIICTLLHKGAYAWLQMQLRYQGRAQSKWTGLCAETAMPGAVLCMQSSDRRSRPELPPSMPVLLPA